VATGIWARTGERTKLPVYFWLNIHRDLNGAQHDLLGQLFPPISNPLDIGHHQLQFIHNMPSMKIDGTSGSTNTLPALQPRTSSASSWRAGVRAGGWTRLSPDPAPDRWGFPVSLSQLTARESLPSCHHRTRYGDIDLEMTDVRLVALRHNVTSQRLTPYFHKQNRAINQQ
jgi:hypothetical protein